MNKKIKKSVKTKIFEYCIENFSRIGYNNVGVRNISEGTGLSIGAIYYYFPSKEKIARFLYDTATELILENIKKSVGEARGDEEVIKSIIVELFRLTEESPRLMEYALYVKHKDFLPDVLPVCSSKPFEYIKSFMRKKIEEGVFEDMDIVVASALVMGPIIRIVQLRLDNLLKDDIRKYAVPIFEGIIKSTFKKVANKKISK